MENILLAIIAGLTKSIILGIIGLLFKSDNFSLRLIGYTVTLSVLGGLTFMILVAAALNVINIFNLI